jgi:hypothetical protein
MTAFLSVDISWAQAAPTRLREVLHHVDASRPAGWLITPIRNWRIGNKAPELPPG